MSESADAEGSGIGSVLIKGFLKHPLLWMTAIGLLIRIIVGIFLTYNFDVSHWALVIENIRSGNNLYELDGYYYTPPWGYVLAFLSSIGDLVGVGDLGARVLDALSVESYTEWHITATLTTIPFNMLIKVPLFLCDIAVAYVIRWIVLRVTDDKRKANIAYILWLLCPLVIAVSSAVGMFDTILVLTVLLSVVFLMKESYFLAGTMFGLAVLIKFFPVFFIFLFVAYIIAKHRDDGTMFKNLGLAVAGALTITVVLLLPNILEGSVGETISFLTTRVGSGVGAGLGSIESYGTMLAYIAFLVVSIYIACCMYRGREEGESLDRKFMFLMLVNTTVLFLYPSTPQYILLLLPFVICAMMAVDGRFKIPFIMFAIGSAVFALSSNFMFLLSFSAFTDMLSIESLMPLIDMFQEPLISDINAMKIMYFAGGITQYAATIYVLILVYKMRKECKNDPGLEWCCSCRRNATVEPDDLK